MADSFCFTGTDPDGFCAPTGTITFDHGSPEPYTLTVPDWPGPHVARLCTAGPGWAGAPPGVEHLTDLPAAVAVFTGGT